MLKAKIQTKARSVVLMRPTLWTFGYDLAVVPNHDRMKSHPKIIRTVLAPTTIQPTGHERSGRPSHWLEDPRDIFPGTFIHFVTP